MPKDAVLWGTIAVYILLLVGVGLAAGRGSRSIADITVGGRQTGAWLSALSYGTAYFSAVMFVGYAGSTGYSFGLWGVLAGLGNVLFGSLLAWLVLARRTRKIAAELNLHTMPEFLEKRYGSRAMKFFACLVIFVFLVPYSASVYKGLASIAQVLLGVGDMTFMIIIAALAALLLLFGGYLVQARADFIQGLIMMAGVALLIYFVLKSKPVGGFAGIAAFARQNPLAMPRLDAERWWALLSLVLMTSFGTWGLPHMIGKFFGLKDNRQARRGITISTLFALLVAGGGYFIGSLCHMFLSPEIKTALLSEHPATFTDYIVPTMLKLADIPSVLLGVVLVLLIAASVSTLCSVTLTASSTLVLDFYRGFRPQIGERKLRLGTKLVCLTFVAASFAVANSKTPIFDLMSYSWGIISGSFLAPYVLALYYKKTSRAGAWSGILTGFLTALPPAVCKLATVFMRGGAGAVVEKLAGYGTQFAVAAMALSVVVCFAVSAWGARRRS
ncbi:MAG: sodium:solute symporter family protein [Oscillospiraceae bacterium]|jgi:SSS family solute:Na+ symporter/sodium/proline symporter|nr:sodium:solute symporter family protein [Oscillospiraceae bacterium]